MDPQSRIAELEAEVAAKDAEVAAKDAEVAVRDERIRRLEEQVGRLLEVLGKHSGNSNLPPSSDRPGKKEAAKRKPKGKRKRGGQKGHKGSHRALVPPEEVDIFVELYPDECESCWKPLAPKLDAFAKRYQQTELAPFAPKITEYRRHAVLCPCCGYRTRAAYDQTVIPRTAFGPRLMATVVMLTGVYHLSRRKTAQLLYELLGLRISVGSVSRIEARMSDAIVPAAREAFGAAMAAQVKHTDGTTWLQAGVLLSLWTVATAAVTVFKILPNGQRATLREHLLCDERGVLVSDRATALLFWEMGQRQICLAHLLRKFVSFSERDGPAGRFGKQLLDYLRLVFAYWRDLRDGKLSRALFRLWMAPVRVQFEALLERVVAADIHGVSGSCADMLTHKKALWTFVDRDDVEPTNNHAERELRRFVLWRKRSFGTQSERGNLFAARVMTIAHTARKQARDVLAFFTDCAQAWLAGTAAPSLLAPG